MLKEKNKKNAVKTPVIATRKTCKATGTGLSHYVMMEPAKKK